MYQDMRKDSYELVMASGEDLMLSLENIDFDELQNQVDTYTKSIEKQFHKLESDKPTETVLNQLETLLQLHQNILSRFELEKKKLASKLKNLHAGKAMQNTYPGNEKLNMK